MADHLPPSLGELAQAAIAKYLKSATQYEKGVLRDTDPENLHQMRVGMRRLRTAMQVFGPSIHLPKAGQEPKLAAIARKLGQLRDLDVIEATLRQQFWPDLPEPEQAVLADVFAYLAQQRQKAFKRVKSLLKGKRYKALKKALKIWVKQPRYEAIAPLAAETALPDLISPLLSKLWLHPGWLVGTESTAMGRRPRANLTPEQVDQWVNHHSDALHGLRKQVKRVRYQLKLVDDWYGDALASDLDNFSALQDVLGHLQDSLLLADFLEAAMPQACDRMPTLFSLLAHSRHHAWTQWQALQQHYLQETHRQTLRLTLLQPGSNRQDDDATTASSPGTAAVGRYLDSAVSPATAP
ncbi:hypothetical protein XM38_015900 [Halomicronema hongdechloris C2206]|uniref:CHAD domain-containing protein n=1 Tax=Halomicronema hongdechloris C2206 TaxID=1641165 RepID=A0A1Z3HK17_9CYAN|nr:CHAD domain-containing protein [Halomicronema hongdechloris]ASC70650.1 hypothetical protein XM38_015900 [Halomicronema hongdechloris C2206]